MKLALRSTIGHSRVNNTIFNQYINLYWISCHSYTNLSSHSYPLPKFIVFNTEKVWLEIKLANDKCLDTGEAVVAASSLAAGPETAADAVVINDVDGLDGGVVSRRHDRGYQDKRWPLYWW